MENVLAMEAILFFVQNIQTDYVKSATIFFSVRSTEKIDPLLNQKSNAPESYKSIVTGLTERAIRLMGKPPQKF